MLLNNVENVNYSVGTMASKQYYLADLFCDRNGSVRSNMANRSEQTTFWLIGSRSGTHFPQALINYTYETVQQHNKITYRSNSNKRAIKLVHQRTTTFSNVRQTAKHEAASFAQRNCDVIHQAAAQPRSQGPLSTSRKYPGYGWSRVC